MLIITTKRRQRQREDEVWSEGYHTGDDEVEDFIAQKDDFIERQTGIIADLIAVLNRSNAWPLVPEELARDLGDYV